MFRCDRSVAVVGYGAIGVSGVSFRPGGGGGCVMVVKVDGVWMADESRYESVARMVAIDCTEALEILLRGKGTAE